MKPRGTNVDTDCHIVNVCGASGDTPTVEIGFYIAVPCKTAPDEGLPCAPTPQGAVRHERGTLAAAVPAAPLPPESILFELPSVFPTPHIAGSQGNELARMGTAAVDEIERLTRGEAVAFRVDLDMLTRTA